MGKPIFISYKRVDLERVLEIKNYIESNTGLSCWIDLDGIESDAQYEDVIIEAIDNSSLFLYCYSKEHLEISKYEDDWTIKELNFAQEENKRIVIVNLDRTPLTKKFKFRYRYKQQVDSLDNSRLEKLILDIRKWFNIAEGSKTLTPKLRKDDDCERIKEIVKNQEDPEENISIDNNKSELPKSLSFEYLGKKIYMVLSDDERYYLGNLNSKEGDLSWWDNKWIQTMGVGEICAGSVAIILFPVTVAIILAIKAVSSIFNDEKKDSKEIIVNQELCKKLSESTGYLFSVPFTEELKGVKNEAQKGCIVLRVVNNKEHIKSLARRDRNNK